MADATQQPTAPWHMRLWLWLGVPVIRDMDIAAEWGRARPSERWACLCGSLFGRGIMWPLWKIDR